MEYRRKKTTIILISLLLHLFVLVLLLIFYKSPEHEWTYFDTSTMANTDIQTVFSELPPSLAHEEPPVTAPYEQIWAELKPRASMLGNSMEIPEETIGIESDQEKSEPGADSQSAQVPDQPQPDDDGPINHTSDEIMQAPLHSGHIAALPEEFKIRPVTDKATKVTQKKRKAQKALASITRGYLEQLKNEGENLIKTIGGDPTKMPSAEQLKYERYISKIQWCLQNAHNINRDKCQMHKPIEASMRVYFTLKRDGTITDLKIIQSSGDAFVDRYIKSLFEMASSSFPPMPTYIKEDPYPMLYTVMVCWNVARPSSYMGFMRE